MPYIKQLDRTRLVMGGEPPNTPGELNYLFTMHLLMHVTEEGPYYRLMRRYVDATPTFGYQTINDIIGASFAACMECHRRTDPLEAGLSRLYADAADALLSAAQDFYKAHAAPYEDVKIQQNGDVYP